MSRDKRSQDVRSAVHILRALDCEGFTDHAACIIRRFWNRNIMTCSRAKRVDALHKAFSEMVKEKLDYKDRQLLGRMMALNSKRSFDTGLRIGMAARVAEAIPDKEADNPMKLEQSCD